MSCQTRFILTAVFATVLLLPASAAAGTVTTNPLNNYNPSYGGAAGEVNNVVVTGNGAGVTITDTAGATAGTLCSQVNATTISCAGDGFGFKLEDQNDTLSYAGGSFPYQGDGGNSIKALVIDGGAGSDSIGGSPYDDSIDGGDGSDVLRGGDGNDGMGGDGDNDTVLGEGGNDSGIDGGGGTDTVDGGPGADNLTKHFHAGGCSGPDTLIGGSGKDTFDVSCGTPTLKFRDGQEDIGRCANGVTSAIKEFDKFDKAEGGPCQTYIRTCKKGKKRKKGKSASAAKKKKKKCKRKKYEQPQEFSLSLGGGLTLTRP